jgi:hypothetical protein
MRRAGTGAERDRPIFARAGMPLLLGWAVTFASVCGCSHTLTEGDCNRYREKLHGWAAARASASGVSEKSDPKAQQQFLESCKGTAIPRSSHQCLERAADEQAFFACLE